MNRGTPHFVGRDAQLEQLHQEFQQTNQLAICAIAGMGGVGKTELALQYALKNQHNYPGGLCWFPVRGLDLGTQVVNFARTKLGLTIPEELEFNQQVEYCWGHWPEGTALIVLDDVPSFSNDYKQRIQPYLPPAQSRFKVLVTSRQRPGASYRRIDLDVLSPEAALELLRSRSVAYGQSLVGKERIEKEPNEAEALCEWLGYLPLGLELVGRYLDIHPNLTIAKVQKRLEKKKLAAKALLYQTEQGEITAQLGVAAAFELSWEDLEESPEAQQLGCRLSLFAPAPFDWSLVESCVIETEDEEEWEEEQEELEELRDSFLVNRNLLQLTEQQTYRLHQLIREFFQSKLAQLPEADGYKQSFCKTMVAVAKEIPFTATLEIIAAVNPAIPHLVETATVLTDCLRDEDLIWPLTGLGKFYYGQGTYDQAELWWKQCLEITRTRLGENHPDVASSLNNLALLYWSMGRYDLAEPLYKQALELYKQLLGHHYPDVATSLNNLALLYYSMGRYDQAEPLYQKVLELYKQLLGQDHPDVARSLNNLALLYWSMGRYDLAEPLIQQALELFKQLLGHHHPLVAISLNNLGLLYKSMGRYDQAEPLIQQALEITKQGLGQDHPHVATSLNNLAALYDSMGRYDQAEPLLQQALELYKQLLGHHHPDVATSLNNLALLYKSMGRYEQAEPLIQQALELYKQLLGHEHPHVATSLNNLALLYWSMGSYGEAEQLYQQALELYKLLGDDHPDVATSLNNLALLYDSMGRYDQAEALFVQALEIAEQKLGSNHPNTVSIRKNLESLRDIKREQGTE
ncbi:MULTISPECIES: tetratricopeptide repeat protein [Moorena]|uniref:tetratricopeptide repeat protein n=1 Tax=Moorena TaxID=1155738 RepID=UPI0006936757|nr:MULTISPECIES: tetratricopeptide repeat protein [Moorena]OLT67027.1 tetratricopeptide repeat protein [Moorena producens 3L]